MVARNASNLPTLSPRSEVVARNIVVNGYDLEEARSAVSRIFVDHRFAADARKPSRPVRVSYTNFDALSLCYFDYGRKIEIQPDQLRDFYLLLIPLSGHSQLKCGSRAVEVGQGSAALLPAERDFRIQFSADARQMIVRVDRRKLTQCAENYLGRSLSRSPDIEPELAWSFDEMAPLRHAVGALFSLGNQTLPTPSRKMLMQSAEEFFLNSLLFLQRNDMSLALASGRLSDACPRVVRRAESYIAANLADPISISDLVKASGGSTRTLFDSFKRFRKVAPMQYVRRLRLDRAHQQLQSGNEGISVSSVAVGFGFQHLGRFATDYFRVFAEMPSETLKRARSR